MHFDLTDLRLFLHVAEAGSITGGRGPLRPRPGLRQRARAGHGGAGGRGPAGARAPRRRADARRAGRCCTTPGWSTRADRADARRAGRVRARAEGPRAPAGQHRRRGRTPARGAGGVPGREPQRGRGPGRAAEPRRWRGPSRRGWRTRASPPATPTSRGWRCFRSGPTGWCSSCRAGHPLHGRRRVAFAEALGGEFVGLSGDSALGGTSPGTRRARAGGCGCA